MSGARRPRAATMHRCPAPSTPVVSARVRADGCNGTRCPRRCRSAIEDRLGSAVVAARFAGRRFLAGRRGAACSWPTAHACSSRRCAARRTPTRPRIHRREARVAAALPAGRPRARAALVVGRRRVGRARVRRRRRPHAGIAVARRRAGTGARRRRTSSPTRLTPSPIALEPASEPLAPRCSAAGARDRRRTATGRRTPPDRQSRTVLDDLVELESRWPEAVRGDTLVHLDLRADNLLLTPRSRPRRRLAVGRRRRALARPRRDAAERRDAGWARSPTTSGARIRSVVASTTIGSTRSSPRSRASSCTTRCFPPPPGSSRPCARSRPVRASRRSRGSRTDAAGAAVAAG